jgi:hypothetical protein
MRGRPADDSRRRRALTAAGVLLALGGAVAGLAVSLGAWDVGYCGALTPDLPPPGSLRHDLCRGTTGAVVGGAVLACWAAAVAAPLVGLRLARRSGRPGPLIVAAVCAAGPLVLISVLSAALPQD